MSSYDTTCPKCNTKLIVDDEDCYAGGLRDNESISCPKCGASLGTVYTSGTPHVYYDTTKSNK